MCPQQGDRFLQICLWTRVPVPQAKRTSSYPHGHRHGNQSPCWGHGSPSLSIGVVIHPPGHGNRNLSPSHGHGNLSSWHGHGNPSSCHSTPLTCRQDQSPILGTRTRHLAIGAGSWPMPWERVSVPFTGGWGPGPWQQGDNSFHDKGKGFLPMST